ncbi:UNVERIFIED_CONTAM: Pleiotropic drug resistance protein 2 [Sesamum latifolium]|uniref:Pleiotropic drug resistance protein 2 n=1 Tax=Sesamum latifolium TaxID=2727402 RepID=A0AAW2TAF9_9LAMI
MKSGQIADGGKFYGALFFSLINVMFNGTAELALTVLRLPVFFKQRDALFYPAWAFSLPIWLLRIPLSLMESLIWIVLTYYTIGFAPEASRFFRQLLAFFALHQMALSLFRFIAALGRTQVVANTLGTFTLLMVFVLGGFIIAKDDIKPWMIWGYYVSPMMYGQNAIAINEFLDKRWSSPNNDPRFPEPTVGKVLLSMRGMFLEDYMYWVCVAALFAFSILFNICFIVALTYLKPFGDSKSIIPDEKNKKKKLASDGSQTSNSSAASAAAIAEGKEMSVRSKSEGNNSAENSMTRKGMVLPFTPLSLAFHHVNYYVDMPAEIPIWWRWYYWASPVAWTIYGLVTSQVGDRNDPVEVPGLPDISVKEYLDCFLGFKYDFLGAVAGAHVGWAILFCLVFAYGIKYLNFQRR